MKFGYILSALITTFLLSSCGGQQGNNGNGDDADSNKVDSTSTAVAEECSYSLIGDSTAVSWTAYKFTSKAGVGGKFTGVKVKANNDASSLEELLEGATFSIAVDSINSGDTSRDRKIGQYFFDVLTNSSMMSGTIITVAGDDKSGTMEIDLRLNDTTNVVSGAYTLGIDGNITLDAELDMSNWNALPAIEALNKACEDLHTGNDGVSKLWPNVSVLIEGYVKKDCKDAS